MRNLETQLIEKAFCRAREHMVDPSIIIMHPVTLREFSEEVAVSRSFIRDTINTYRGIEIITSEDLPQSEIRVY